MITTISLLEQPKNPKFQIEEIFVQEVEGGHALSLMFDSKSNLVISLPMVDTTPKEITGNLQNLAWYVLTNLPFADYHLISCQKDSDNADIKSLDIDNVEVLGGVAHFREYIFKHLGENATIYTQEHLIGVFNTIIGLLGDINLNEKHYFQNLLMNTLR